VSAPVIGVDLGGTKVAVASLTGSALGESLIQPTEKASGDALMDQIVAMVGQVRGHQLSAVGIGVPSIVEFATGRIISSINVPLADLPLRKLLGDRLGVPVFVDNDATVAGFAEAHDEYYELVSHNLVIFTIGTGVGGGIVLGGKIYRGATGGAGELGHMIIGMDLSGSVPAPMRFPQPGSLEFAASGHALDRLAEQAAQLHPESPLGKIAADGKDVLGADAVAAAHAGDASAQRMIEIWGQRLGIGIANAINTFDPDEVVIGGGAAQAGSLLLTPAIKIANGYVLPGLAGHAQIRLARHGVKAGVLGAALLARDELSSGGPS
jgi:glucokinase